MPALLEPNYKRLFYEPIVLEYALQKACRQDREVFNESPQVENGSLAPQVQAFYCFVDKLAQVCDNRRGGSTVTAFSVLSAPDGPEFVFASNGRDVDELSDTCTFVEELLHLVGSNPTGLKQKALNKQVLWKILLFNLSRLNEYLNKLAEFLDACIVDSERRNAPEVLRTELKKLKDKAEFPRDIVSDNSRSKCKCRNISSRRRRPDRYLVLSDCEKLIKAIFSIKSTQIDTAIIKNARDGDISGSELWCELRHYLGRLLSFRQATTAILGAQERFPNLFKDFRVTPVPSSESIPKPIAKSKSITAESIIKAMIPDEEDQEVYLEKADEMQMHDLDNIIQSQIGKRSFRPLVHAEVVVHEYLVGRNLHPRDYWNSWKYIGGSKPTCRLCSYYFGAHTDRVRVRKTHFNLYPNWRLPGLFETRGSGESSENIQRRLHLLQQITERVQDDAKRTLDEKRPLGKNHDSNTYTTMPGLYRYGYTDSMSASEVAAIPRSMARLQIDRRQIPRDDVSDADGLSNVGDADATDVEENAGDVLLFRGRV